MDDKKFEALTYGLTAVLVAAIITCGAVVIFGLDHDQVDDLGDFIADNIATVCTALVGVATTLWSYFTGRTSGKKKGTSNALTHAITTVRAAADLDTAAQTLQSAADTGVMSTG